jgi:IS5 family transposase
MTRIAQHEHEEMVETLEAMEKEVRWEERGYDVMEAMTEARTVQRHPHRIVQV